MQYRATLAYDGTAYQGFQRQADGIPTIQASVEAAVLAVTQQQVTVTGAGRTDAGVHARGQVIAFSVEWKHDTAALLRALNAVLPDDIALQDLAETPNVGFHPRFSARSRRYCYTVLQAPQRQPLMRNRAWYVWQRLDVAAMQAAASLLIGRHDFATFGNPPYGENTVREVFHSTWEQSRQNAAHSVSTSAHSPDILLYHIEATAFLHHMVRRIVGMLVEVGRGDLSVEMFERSFRSADLAFARTIAPAHGLSLEAVSYPENAGSDLS
jgi:tRNA pseudouridine38-40 synthase